MNEQKKDKNAYGGYSKYYSSSNNNHHGTWDIVLSQRSGLDRKKRMNINRQFLDTTSLNSQVINMKESQYINIFINDLKGSIYGRICKFAERSSILGQEFQAEGFNYRKIHVIFMTSRNDRQVWM